MIIDGLICSRISEQLVDETREGGIDCVTVTCGFWEDSIESMDSIVRWTEFIRSNSAKLALVTSVAALENAVKENKLGIILGFQNSSFLQDRIGYVELFYRMGVRVAQLTYNIQNTIGGSCYDDKDSGLTKFGHEVVEEMNRVGMIIDCSHVGDVTTMNTVEASQSPIALTHSNVYEHVAHPRNKRIEVVRALANRGGIVGLTMYRNLARGFHRSADEWSELVARTVDVVGVDHVAIGTDTNTGGTPDYLDWMRKGRWSRKFQAGATLPGLEPIPRSQAWYESPREHLSIQPALERRGFTSSEIKQILGLNWRRFYGEVESAAH